MTKAQILIVEDGGIIAMDLESRLKSLGYSVSAIVASGEEALKKAEEHNPDLVMMDIVLKGELDGIEAAYQIRTRFDKPVVFITAFMDEDRLERSKLTLPFGYILKPFRDRDLKITIEMALYTAKVDAKRKQATEQALKQRALLEAINTVFQETLTCESDEEVANACLGVAQKLTDSEFGWIGEINKDGCLDTIALSDPGWTECRIPKDDSVRMIKNMKIRGIWGRTLLDNQSQIVNDPASHPDSVGLPEGHPPLTSFLGIPLKHAGKTIGMIGLGNKSLGYDNSDRQDIEALSIAFVEALHRKRADEALRASEEKYRVLIKNLPSIVYRGYKDWSVEFIDNKIELLTGYGADEFNSRRMKWCDIIVEKDIEKATEGFIQALKTDMSYVREYRIKSKVEGIIWIQERGQIVCDNEGEIEYVNGVFFDVTDHKRAEKALRESEEKLTRSKKMESLGLLAGGVAHDLNNVLSGIVSYPELLLLDMPEDNPLRKPIETIQESGYRAAAIVQDLITVARGVAIAKEPLNLNAIVEDYLLSPEFEKLKHFHPTVTINTNLATVLFNVSGSDAHLRKVVMNLVSNASEAIEGSGNVIISTMNRYIDRFIRGYDDVNVGEYAVLSVSDDGPGISPNDLERIFEPFYTKKVMGRSGTGLGLAVVWNVVQDLKGYLNVISDENGTTFELYFPITRDEVSDKDLPISIKDYKGNGETVLVVDDVENQREIACEMLNTLGYKAKAVSSGEEAVEYLKEHTVDLILLDMIMDPGINGLETYERIIKIHPNQKTVIASGFAETDDVKEAQKLGAGQYIKKPLTLEKMGIVVRDELKK